MSIEDHATRLLEATAENVRAGGGPFGALIVLPDGTTITEFNTVTANHDPTGHAEVNAIRAAAQHLATHDLDGLTLLATGEPCPMCLAACLWARLGRVVYINTLEDAALAGLDDTRFYDQLRYGVTDLVYEHLPHDEAALPYQAWEEHPDRINY